MSRRFLFLSSSTRQPDQMGNSETLARRAAAVLPSGVEQQWLTLATMPLPDFVDLRHTVGNYPMPESHARTLLDATLAATDLVLVSPVYWFSIPSPMKRYLDHWSAWMRVPGLDFKPRMAGKRLWVITTSGDRATAQPMIDSYRLCADFMAMPFMGALWGKGGAPDAVLDDAAALAEAQRYLLASESV